ncbi:MAG: hypothetical protein JWP97_836 [Labilithrix sp.]|nr:hypothetical protein [Labilithrix sp.]
MPRLPRWLPGPVRRVDLASRLLAPALLALVPLFWVVDATYRASLTTVGRDQGIFQYIAWALDQGAVDYRDIRDVNGPLVHMIHGALMALGGADEHRFHVLELAATGVTFAFTAACLPGIFGRHRAKLIERLAWGAAGWVVLSAQYMLYIYWNQAQRESFCDWFLLPSLGLGVLPPSRSRPLARTRITAIAFLSVITWLGKPTFAVFTIMQLFVLLVDTRVLATARQKLASFAIGGVLGGLVPLVWLVRRGDLRAFLRISLVDVPQIYRFIWAKSVPEIFGEEGAITAAAVGLAAAALVVGLVVMRELPRRALVIGLAPLCGLANVVVQHKGFGYHFHPLTAASHLCFLLVGIMLVERFRTAPRRRPGGRLVALAVVVMYALEVASSMRASPHERNVWILAGGETAERRSREEYFQTFKTYDFHPWDLRRASAYLRETTSASGRVQVYGMDPYLLFLARRLSATPYIYAYDLNNDAALEGGWSNEPNELDLWRIRRARDDHEADLLARVKAAPPEAFVFIDSSPLITSQDAWEDFRHACHETSRWVAEHYHQARSFGEVHVWLRDDTAVGDDESVMPRDLRPPPMPLP